MHYPDKTGRHEPYESRGSRADLWGPEAAMPPATRRAKTSKASAKKSATRAINDGRAGR